MKLKKLIHLVLLETGQFISGELENLQITKSDFIALVRRSAYIYNEKKMETLQ